MNLGIVADEISRDFRKAVETGTELGLRRFEIRFLQSGRVPFCDASEMRGATRIAADAGVSITAISPGLFKLTDDAFGFDYAINEVYPKAAEWAHLLKLPGMIVFGFRKPGVTEENFADLPRTVVPNQIVDWLAEAGERAESDGLLLMIEPEPICWADTARVTADLIERSGAASLRINYDPGNVAWLTGYDPIGEFETASRWIANVHVKDLVPPERGAGRPVFVPAGEGIIDYRAHFAALRTAGYSGPVSLEPHMDGSRETIRRCSEAATRQYQTGTQAES